MSFVERTDVYLGAVRPFLERVSRPPAGTPPRY
jgi:hypothetical protein